MKHYKQSPYGIVKLRVEHIVTMCRVIYAERVAQELNDKDASGPRLIASGMRKSYDAAEILRLHGILTFSSAPTHPDCKCERCSPDSEENREHRKWRHEQLARKGGAQ